jgi:WD40 repeat protein
VADDLYGPTTPKPASPPPQEGNDGLPAAEWPVVPGYQILEVLGRGGMGVVYKARQVGLGRYVALKMILSGAHAGPEDMVRFLAEGEAVAQLQHGNIVQIYQVGRHGDVPFFSLEYVDGGTLAQRLDGTPRQPRDAARLVECLAHAMHLAHQKGIIHRDLKPSNILLASGGRQPPVADEPTGDLRPPLADCVPKIADFGLAKHVQGGSGLTQTGAILGTPSYMSPEQAEGKKDVGIATDIYALGAILYEMLTGRPPFRAPTHVETVMQVIGDEPVSPTRLQPNCPRDLETICLKCLHKEPARRYASAEALAEDLQRFLTDRPVLARRAGPLERLRRWRRRNPILADLVAAVAVLLLLLAVVSTVAAIRLDAQRDRAERSRREAEGNLQRAVAAEEEKQEQLWQELVARAKAGRFSRRVGQRFDSLAALGRAARMARERQMPAERFDQLRHEAIACLALPDIRVHEWDGWPEDSAGLDYNGERGLYARGDARGGVSVRRLDDDTGIARLPGDGVKVQPYFSEDGRFLLLRELGGEHRIKAWRPGEDKPFVVVPESADVKDVRIAPDGRRFAVAHKAGSVHLYELPSGRRTVLADTRTVQEMRFGPEGRWLAVGRVGSLQLYDLPAGSRRVLEEGPSIHYLWFAPGGRQLAALAGGYNHPEMRFVRIFDLETGRLAARLEHPDSVCTVSWHPDGKCLATGTFDSSLLSLWDVPSRTRTRAISSHKGGGLHVFFNRTGELLLSVSKWSGGSRLWHPCTGKLLLVSPRGDFEKSATNPAGYLQTQTTADGRLLALVPVGRKLHLSEAHPSREYRTLARDSLRTQNAGFRAVTVHPDGRLLAAGQDDGVGLWNLDDGEQVSFLGLGRTNGAVFDGTGALWTWGSIGLRHWRVSTEPAAAHRLRLGAPQIFSLPCRHSDGDADASRDGRMVVCAADFNRGAAVVHRDRPDRPVWLSPQHDVRGVAASPNGELVATGSFNADPRTPKSAVKIWQAHTGRLLKELPPASNARPCFSPDGRWLAIGKLDEGVRVWSVEDWREHLRIDGALAAAPKNSVFSPDSKLLAVEDGNGVLRLIDINDGRTVTRLEDPDQARGRVLAFSPDGTRLIAASNDDQAIHVWDLRALRGRLTELGLDWDAPSYPPAEPSGSVAHRLQVTVDAVGPSRANDPEPISAGQQMRNVLNRITAGDNLDPTRVQLRLKDVPPADAVRTLARQARFPILYVSPPGVKEPVPRISLDLKDVGVWEALDQICAASRLGYSADALNVRVSPQYPPPNHIRAYAGPFRLETSATTYQRNVNLSMGTPRLGESLFLNLRMLKEPQAPLLSVRAPRLTEARAGDGQSLLTPAPASIPFSVQGEIIAGYLSVPLKVSGRSGGKLAILRGALPVEIASRQRELIAVPDLAKAKGRTFRGERGHRLTVQNVQRTGTTLTLLLRLSGPPGWNYNANSQRLELIDAEGRHIHLRPSWLVRTPPELLAGDAAWLAAAPLAPSLSNLPWPVLALHGVSSSRRMEWYGPVNCFAPEPLAGPIQLRFYQFERLKTEVPFELRDVPLP